MTVKGNKANRTLKKGDNTMRMKRVDQITIMGGEYYAGIEAETRQGDKD